MHESDKRQINGYVLCVEQPWLEFNPSPPSFIVVLDENMNFIPNLKSWDVAGSRLQSAASWLSMTIQLILCLQQFPFVSTYTCHLKILILIGLSKTKSTKRLTQNQHVWHVCPAIKSRRITDRQFITSFSHIGHYVMLGYVIYFIYIQLP